IVALSDFPDSVHQFLTGSMFQDITRRAASERLRHKRRIVVHRQENDLSVGSALRDLSYSIESVENRHRDVYKNHIRLQTLCRFHQLFTVSRRAKQLKLVPQQTLQPLSKHDVIV